MDNENIQGTPSTPEPDVTPNSGGSKVLRIILSIILIGFFLVAGAVYFVYTRYLDKTVLKAQFEEQVAGFLGLPVSVADIQLDFPTVKLTEIQIGSVASSPLPFLNVSQINATPDVWELIGGKVVFESISLASGSLKLVRDASGIVLPDALKKSGSAPPPGGQEKTGAFPLRNFDAKNLRIEIQDIVLGKTFQIKLPNGELSRAAFGGNIPVVVDGSLDEYSDFSIKGQIGWPEKIDAKILLSKINLKNLKSLLPPTVQIPEQISPESVSIVFSYETSGKLNVSELTIDAKPDLAIKGSGRIDSFSPINGLASVTFEPVALDNLLKIAKPFLPEQVSDLKVSQGRISGGGTIGIASGAMENPSGWVKLDGIKCSIPSLDFPMDGLSGKIEFSRGRLSWNNLDLTTEAGRVSSKKGEIDIQKAYSGFADLDLNLEIEKAKKVFGKYLPQSAKKLEPSGTIEFVGKTLIDGMNSTIDGRINIPKGKFLSPVGNIPIEIARAKANLFNLSSGGGKLHLDEAEIRILGTAIQAKGDLENPFDPKFSFDATANVDLAQLHAALPIANEEFKKKTKLHGKAAVSAKLSGTAKKPDLFGKVQLSEASFSFPERKIHFANINGILETTLDSVKAEKLKADVSGGKLQLDGKLENFSKPVLTATGNLSGVDLSEIREFLGHNFSTFPKDLQFSGKADLEMALSGPAMQPQVKGTAILGGDTLSHPAILRPITQIVGPVKFDNRTINADELRFAWGSSTVRVTGRIEDLAVFKTSFDYSVAPLDLTDIGGFFLGSTGYKVTGAGNGRGKIRGPIEKLVIDGMANIPTGVFEAPVSKTNPATFKFPFTNLAAPFRFTEGVLELTGIRADVFSGKLESSGKVFVKETPIRFQFDSKATSLSVQDFFALNSSQKNVLTGGLDFSFKANGNTTGLDSLDGASTVNMKDGKYQTPPVAAQIFELLNAKNLASGNLSGVNGTFIFKGGKMNSNDLMFRSSMGNATYKGTVGLDTSLNGTMYLNLTSQACEGSSILKQLKGDEQTLNIPVGIKGSILAPGIDLRVDKLLEEVAKRKVKSAITDAIFGKPGKQPPVDASGTVQPEKPKDPKKVLLEGLGNIILGPRQPKQETPAPAPAPAQPKTPAPTPPPVATQTTPAPLPPDKAIKQEIKNIEKDLKNLFKF